MFSSQSPADDDASIPSSSSPAHPSNSNSNSNSTSHSLTLLTSPYQSLYDTYDNQWSGATLDRNMNMNMNMNLNMNNMNMNMTRGMNLNLEMPSLAIPQLGQPNFLSLNSLEQPVFRSLTMPHSSSSSSSSASASTLLMNDMSMSVLERLSLSNVNSTQAHKQSDVALSALMYGGEAQTPLNALKYSSLPEPVVVSSVQPSTLAAVTVNAPQCPAHILVWSSFIVFSVNSLTLLKQIADILKSPENNIQVSENQTKHKLKCVAFCPKTGNSLQFVVRVYQSSSSVRASATGTVNHSNSISQSALDNQFIVEFQRRSGCTVGFNYLYKRVRNQLHDIVIVDLRYDENMYSADDMQISAKSPTLPDALSMPPMTQSLTAPPSLSMSLSMPALVKATPSSASLISSLYTMTLESKSADTANCLMMMDASTIVDGFTSSPSLSMCSLVQLLISMLSSDQHNYSLIRCAAALFNKLASDHRFAHHITRGHVHDNNNSIRPLSEHDDEHNDNQCTSDADLFSCLFGLLDEPDINNDKSVNACSSYGGIFQVCIKRLIAEGLAQLCEDASTTATTSAPTARSSASRSHVNSSLVSMMMKTNDADYMRVLTKILTQSENADRTLQQSVKKTLTRLGLRL